MKKLLTFIFIISLAQWCNGQQIINARKVTTSESLKPPIDTIVAPSYLNEVRLRTQDTAWYVFMQLSGKRWYKFTTTPGDPNFFHRGPGITYFVSSAGNDANHGMSPDAPWQTIAKVNATDFNPGDRILFRGGDIFTGTITLTAQDSGSAGFPVVVSSYGRGRAKISSGAGNGVDIRNAQYMEVRKLEMFGNSTISGAQANHGVYIWQNQNTLDVLTHFVVDDCVIYSYSHKGVNISTWDYTVSPPGGEIATTKSFDSVTITNNDISDCGFIGIYTEGNWPASNHKNLYVAFNKVHHIQGNPEITIFPTGSGIQISGFDGGIVEYNEVYENGTGIAGFTDGGPVGIWAVDALHIIIQYNESHHNHANTGGVKDGGGFDMDGGASKCITQYNYSHDNEGPGFMVYDYGSSEMDSLIIRYNVSVNDVTAAPNYGSLFFGGSIANNIKRLYVYNNTVFIDTLIETNSAPSASNRAGIGFTGFSTAVDSFFFYNNIIQTNGAPTWNVNPFPANTLGSNNIYFAPVVAAEMNLSAYGAKTNPKFFHSGYVPSSIGVTKLWPPYKNPRKDLIGYVPRFNSPAVEGGIVMKTMNEHYDFINNYIIIAPLELTIDVGAFESMDDTPSPTAQAILNFPSTGAGLTSSLTIPVPGAVEGDIVSLGTPSASILAGLFYFSRVNAPNTVTITLFNTTTGAKNPLPGLFKVQVHK
jgi:hypothetical protein